MKKLLFLMAIVLILLSTESARALDSFGYSWYAIDDVGQYMPNDTVDVKVSILEGTTTVYQEIHSDASTDQFAIFILEIGTGTPTTGYDAQDFADVVYAANVRLRAEVSDDGGSTWSLVTQGDMASLPTEANLELTQHYVFMGDASGKVQERAVGGDLTATNSSGVANFQIAADAVTNTEIADTVEFAEIQNASGVKQFSVLNNDRGLRFAGTGGTSVTFDDATNKVTFGLSAPLPPNTSNEPYYIWTPSANLPNAKHVLFGDALAEAPGASEATFNVLYDDVTIGVNQSNQLYLKDNAVTASKISQDEATGAKIIRTINEAQEEVIGEWVLPETIVYVDSNPASGDIVGNYENGFTIQDGAVTSSKIVNGTIKPEDMDLTNPFGIDITGNAATATRAETAGTADKVANPLTDGFGIIDFTYDGSAPGVTVAVDQSANYNWTGTHTFGENVIMEKDLTVRGTLNADISGTADKVANPLTEGAGIVAFSYDGGTAGITVAIANDGITSDMLQANSVTATKIMNDAAMSDKLVQVINHPDGTGQFEDWLMPDGVVFSDQTPTTGDIGGTFDDGFTIADGAVNNTKIAGTTSFVDVQNLGGVSQFNVTNANQNLRFTGTGEAQVSFNPADHLVTINVDVPQLPQDLSNEPYLVYQTAANLPNSKVFTSGDAFNVTPGASNYVYDVLYDDVTIGINVSNQLYLKDGAVTASKLENSADMSDKLVEIINHPDGTGQFEDWLMPDGVVFSDQTPAVVDIDGNYDVGFVIQPNAVTSNKIQNGTIKPEDMDLTNPFGIDITGNAATATRAETAGTADKVANPLTEGAGIVAFSYDGGTAGVTVAVANDGITSAMIKAGAVGNSELASGAVTDDKVADVSWGKITGAPSSYPPSGLAGGDLTGTYPNPEIASDAVTTAEIANGTIKPEDMNTTNPFGIDITGNAATATTATNATTADKVANPLTEGAGIETFSYDGGTAGVTVAVANDGITSAMIKAGAVENSDLASGAVTDDKVTDVSWGKITGAPSSYPPSGLAGGDLTGTYPNPEIASDAVTTAEIANGTIKPEDMDLTNPFGIDITGNAATATTATNATTADKVANPLTDGFGILDFTYDGSTAGVTVAVDQSANYNWTGTHTFNGGINATTFTGNLTGNVTGDVTGDLTGDVTGNVSGNAGSADKVNHTLTASDGITSFTFDGSADATVGISDKGVTTAKINNGTSNQILVTNGTGDAAVWSDNLVVPGTLTVNGTSTFNDNVTIDADLTVTGTLSANISGTADKVANPLTEGAGIADFSYDGGTAGITVAIATGGVTSTMIANGTILPEDMNTTNPFGIDITGNAATATTATNAATADKVANPLTEGAGIVVFSYDGGTAGITVAIANDGITSDMLQANSVTATKIINDASMSDRLVEIINHQDGTGQFEDWLMPEGVVFSDQTPTTGDIEGTFDDGFTIVDGAVNNTKIAGATSFVDVQNFGGISQFNVTNANQNLRFTGTGEAQVSFNPADHLVTINVDAPQLPQDISNEPYLVYQTAPNLPNSKVYTSGDAFSVTPGASNYVYNVLYDDVTIGINGSNQLYLKDGAVTASKLDNSADMSDKLVEIINHPDGSGVFEDWLMPEGVVFSDQTPAVVDIDGNYDMGFVIQPNAVTSNKIQNGTIKPEDMDLTNPFGIDITGNAATATMATNATTADKVANPLTDGFGILDFTYDGSTAGVTVAVDQGADYNWTGTHTFNGGINATTFTGNLTGDVTGNLTGNVTGDVTGDLTGDVTGNVSGNAGSADKVNHTLTASDGITSFTFDGSADATVGIADKGVTTAKINNGTSNQILVTNGLGTAAVWSDNLVVPGTLTVNGTSTFNSNVLIDADLTVTGTLNANISGTADKVANPLTEGAGIADFSYDGGTAGITVAIATDGVTSTMIADGTIKPEDMDLTNPFGIDITGNAATATTATNATTADKVANPLTDGFGILDFTYDGSTAGIAVEVDQSADYTWTGTHTFNGGINATTFTGNLTGNVTGDVSGNAGSADKVNHTLTASDGITSFTFDGSADATVGIADKGVTTAKINNGASNQILVTNGLGTAAVWSDDLVVPGTLTVSRESTFNSNVTIDANLTVTGNLNADITGNAGTADVADKVANPLSSGAALSGGPYDGSAAKTFDVLYDDTFIGVNGSDELTVKPGVNSTLLVTNSSGNVEWKKIGFDPDFFDGDAVGTNLSIKTGAITTTEIQDGTITTADLNTANPFGIDITGNAATATSAATADKVANSLSSGAALSGGPYDGSAAKTFDVLYDDVSVGVNGTNQLEVKDKGVTTAKINNGTGNQVLVTNSAGTAAEWSSSLNVSDITTNDFTTTNFSTTNADIDNLTVTNISGTMDGDLSAGSGLTYGSAVVYNGSTDRTLGIDFTGNYTWTGTNNFTDINITGTITGDVTGNVTGDLNGNAATATTADKVANKLTAADGIEFTNAPAEFDGSAAKTVRIADDGITSAKILNGTITSDDINDNTVNVDVQDNAGTSQFQVTDGSNGLRFEGTNEAQVSFDPANHKVTINVDAYTLPSNISGLQNEPFITWQSSSNLQQEKVLSAGDAFKVTLSLENAIADVLFDGTTIGINGSNELEVKDDGITPAKIEAGNDGQILATSGTDVAWVDPSTFTAGQVDNDLTAGTGLEFTSGTEYNGSADRELRIKAGSITSSLLADNSVTSAKIVDGSIVNADISSSADISVSKLGATTGDNGKVLKVVSGTPTWSSSSTSVGNYTISTMSVESFDNDSTLDLTNLTTDMVVLYGDPDNDAKIIDPAYFPSDPEDGQVLIIANRTGEKIKHKDNKYHHGHLEDKSSNMYIYAGSSYGWVILGGDD